MTQVDPAAAHADRVRRRARFRDELAAGNADVARRADLRAARRVAEQSRAYEPNWRTR